MASRAIRARDFLAVLSVPYDAQRPVWWLVSSCPFTMVFFHFGHSKDPHGSDHFIYLGHKSK